MENQNQRPYRRDEENAEQNTASAEAGLLIKGLHRIGGQRPLNKQDTSDRATRAERLAKQQQALATVASTPAVDPYKKPLSEQIPKLVQGKQPDQVGDRGQVKITPINGNDMSNLSDEAIDEIIQFGIDQLPARPTSEDYMNLAQTKAARQEQFKRSMNAGSQAARPFLMGPTTTA